MGKNKGQERPRFPGSARPRKNRLLGFSGTPTDDEIDEAIEVMVRILVRFMTSEQLVEVMETATRLQAQVARFSSAFGNG